MKNSKPNSEVIVLIWGLTGFFVLASIVGLIDYFTGFSLYGFMIFGLFPGGALVCGIIAASGYFYAAVIKYHQKPYGGIFLNTVLSTGLAFFTIYYIPYVLMEIDGKPLKSMMSFWAYLEHSIKHLELEYTSYSSGMTRKANLTETAPYAISIFQLICLALGSFSLLEWMDKQPFCKNCNRYIRISHKTERYTGDRELYNEMIRKFKKLIDERKFDEALKFHQKEMGIDEESEHHFLRSKVKTGKCVLCGVNFLELSASSREGHSWKELKNKEVKILSHMKI